MSIKVIAIGKKHESWIQEGLERYTKRCKKPYDVTWQLLPHSAQQQNQARSEESSRIMTKLSPQDHVVLLDERGTNLSSPGLAQHLQKQFDTAHPVVVVIGGAYGVDETVQKRANFTWSLSKLVFPHQLVRLVLAEQLYRAQEISAGRPYHHA